MQFNNTKLAFVVSLFIVLLSACSSTVTAKPIQPSNASGSRYIRNEEPNKTKVIVFVHGVTGDANTTWTNEETNAYWPSMVKEDPAFHKANVYVFQYPSPPTGKSLSVDELAEVMRRRLEADGVLKYPELIFLSHSMGGLVTRAFLLRYRDQAAKVKMAYFFATPTEGSPYAQLARLVSKNTQFKSMYPMESDNYLADLQRDWLAARFGIRSFCAYEGKELYGLLIVDQASATNLCNERLDPIAENHINIVKPADAKDDRYIAFKTAYTIVDGDGGSYHPSILRKDHPLIDPAKPIAQQVRLYPEDKVRVFGPETLSCIWLGGGWEHYDPKLEPQRTYMVIGTPGHTVTPKFYPSPHHFIKLEVEYDKYVDDPRDINAPGAISKDTEVVQLTDMPKRETLNIDPREPIQRQVRLYPDDKVRVRWGDSIRRIKLGREWEHFDPGRTYIVTGTPCTNITVDFSPRPRDYFELEVEYDQYLDESRSLR